LGINKLKYKISIIAGEKLTIYDDNVDVEVIFENGEIYSVTLFTLKNIARLLKEYEVSGECASGFYFWASDMVLVNDLKNETIKTVLDDLVETGEFKHACTKLN